MRLWMYDQDDIVNVETIVCAYPSRNHEGRITELFVYTVDKDEIRFEGHKARTLHQFLADQSYGQPGLPSDE